MDGLNDFFQNKEYDGLLQKAVTSIENKIDNYKSIKIGKTGDIKNRFDSAYREEYDGLIEICSSNQEGLIDKLEKWLIGNFKKSYPEKVKNEQDGGGKMEDSDNYYIYIVYSS